MIDKPLCFVDVETTGTNAVNGRIIEIGIVKVRDDEVIQKYETLIDPQERIDPFIEKMTGISQGMLVGAPVFGDIKDELIDLLEDSIFIAHNVQFDYSFVRNEFKRHGVKFSVRRFCTVRLARILYPKLGRYNLDSIMEAFKIENEARHRALGDAKVLWDFYSLSKKINEKEVFENALNMVLKRPSLPPNISKDVVESLPEDPGVYIFLDENHTPIYIGKSISIKDRVLSHFVNEHSNGTDMKIYQLTRYIDHQKTTGELGALLLESELIKKEKPMLNRVLRQSTKKLVLLKKTDKEGFNGVDVKTLDKVKEGEIEKILGVFKSSRQLKDFLYEVCKEYELCPKLMGLDKSKGSCLYYQLGRCKGACGGKENFLKYNLRFDEAFYKGKVKGWMFDGPIYIKEGKEAHVIDKWCYLGKYGEEKKEYNFDWDTYKIISRYLKNPRNLKKVSYLVAEAL